MPSGIDSKTFFTPHIPDDVRAAFDAIHAQDRDVLSSLLNVVVQYLYDGDKMTLPSKLYALDIAPGVINELLSAIYIIMRTAIRTKAKVSVVKNDLLEMKFPAALVDDICSELITSRMPLEAKFISNRTQCAKLERLRWRIDVTISSSSLSRIMRPNILVQIVLKDGRARTFHLSIEEFSQLRYNVAKVLHAIQTLERHPIMKIINEFKRREEDDYNN